QSTLPLFKTQIDWLQFLLSFLAERSDLFLIVRIHPREFPNKREQVQSHHARRLKEALSQLPANVAVNWPSDGISMYDLVDQTDMFLNSWSSVGKEMSLLGIPVVIYSPELPFYPQDLNYCGFTVKEYVHAIEQALDDGWSFERSRRAYRWSALEFHHAPIYI